VGRLDQASLLVDVDAKRYCAEGVERAEDVRLVDDRGEFGARPLVVRPRGVGPLGVTGDGEDLKALVFVGGVEFLPTWQLLAAASPARPGEDQHLLPPVVAQ